MQTLGYNRTWGMETRLFRSVTAGFLLVDVKEMSGTPQWRQNLFSTKLLFPQTHGAVDMRLSKVSIAVLSIPMELRARDSATATRAGAWSASAAEDFRAASLPVAAALERP